MTGHDMKRKRGTSAHERRRVGFSPNVSLRYFFPPASQYNHEEASSLFRVAGGDIDVAKEDAKTLSRMHLRLRLSSDSKISNDNDSTLADQEDDGEVEIVSKTHATQYKLNGESLRGMEHITDLHTGRKRRRIKAEAIQSVMMEQQTQLINTVLDSYAVDSDMPYEEDDRIDQVLNNATRMDTKKIAEVYASKSKEAYRYATMVAEDAAKNATAILTQDLNTNYNNGESSRTHAPLRLRRLSTCSSCVASSNKFTQSDPRAGDASEIVESVCPLHSAVAMQACQV